VADATLFLSGESVTATEGAAFSGLMAVLTDGYPAESGGVLCVFFEGGDGTTTVAIIVSNGLGGFNISGAHTYAEEGSYNAKVTITDDGGSTANVTTHVSVADAPLIASGVTLGVGESAPLNNTVMASFTDANPNAGVSDFGATINWGDGTSSLGTVVANSHGGFDVIGNHVYAEEGSYTATINITDTGGSRATATSNVTVADALLSPSGTTIDAPHGIAFTAVMATFTDADPNGTVGDYSATIAWGDTSTSVGAVSANASGGFNVTGTHTYAAAGLHTATITIHDTGGSSAIVTSKVNDDFPLTATGHRLHVRLGQPFNNLEVASFTDADPGATAGSFSATINWGDGTAPTVGTVISKGSGFDVQGSHTYQKVGGWDVTVTINDTGGGASATVTSSARLFPRVLSY
jgi:hypothetical protein